MQEMETRRKRAGAATAEVDGLEFEGAAIFARRVLELVMGLPHEFYMISQGRLGNQTNWVATGKPRARRESVPVLPLAEPPADTPAESRRDFERRPRTRTIH